MKVNRLMYSIVIAATFLTAIGIASIDLPPSGVIIYAFDQNPAGLEEGNEWVAIHNPTNKSVDIGNWTLETTNGSKQAYGSLKALPFTPEPILLLALLIAGLTTFAGPKG